MTRIASPVRRRRRLFVLTSALGGFVALPAAAQTAPVIPTAADVVTTDPGILFRPEISNPGGNLNVVLRATNTVIDWNGFNIPEGKTANFENGTLLALLGGKAAVLNRDVSGNSSRLLGNMTSDPSVAVWVYNPNGIMVGANAAFNTGSLVLSTLDVTNSDFTSGNSYRLTTGAGSQAAITVMNGAQIRVGGGTRGLVMVAPKIDAQGSFQATGEDVAFVTATDVTLTYNSGSPLSVTLNRGTAVPGRSQYIRGSVAGADALFALASQGTVTDALLQIDAGVTTASTGTRGIVLSAGKPTGGVTGVNVGGTAADTGGVARLLASGPLTVTDPSGSDILAAATGTARFTGALVSGRDIVLDAGGALSVTGSTLAGRDYLLDGRGVALGGTTAATQRAGRAIRVESTDGDITGAAGLALRSGDTGAITLTTGGTTAGDILFDVTSSLTGGSDRQSYVELGLRDATNQLTLGDVTARGLRTAGGTGLTTTGALRLGDVDVRDALSLSAAAFSAGTLASDRGITVTANGALATGAITARGGTVTLGGSGATTVTGTITAAGSTADAVVTRDGALALRGISAGRDVRIDALSGAATVAGAVTAGDDYAVTGSAVTLGGTTAVTHSANGEVTITAGAGGITGATGLTLRANADGLGTDALTLALTGASATGIAFARDTRIAGGTTRQSDVQITLADPATPIALGRVEARNLTGLATNANLRVGDVTTTGNLTASGAAITAGALTSVNGAVSVDGQGVVALGGNVTANGAVTLRGGALDIAGGTVTSGGAIDLLARSGGIASTGPLALVSTSTRSADFVRLQATGADGIVLAAGSSITAGSNRALRVGIFNPATAPLSLGDVTARSLGALAAQGDDATVAGGAIVSDRSLAFGALDLVDGFAAESTSGDLSAGRIAVSGTGQGISLRAANGTLTVQSDLGASGNVILESGTALALGTVESRDGRATLTSGGAVTLATLAGRLGATANGTRLAIDAVRGGPVTLGASAGGAQLGSVSGTTVTVEATGGAVSIARSLTATGAVALTASGDIGVAGAITGTGVVARAQGDARFTGGVQATGDVALTGRSVTLGGTHDTTGRYTVTSTAGDIIGTAGTTVTADSARQGGVPLSLSATGGGIAFDPASSLSGGGGASAVALRTDGGTIAVGNVTATALTADGAGSIRAGNLALSSALTLRAAGDITTGTIGTGTGAVTLDAGGAIAVGNVTATALTADGTGSIRTGNLALSSALTLRAGGGVTTGTIDTGTGAVTLDAGAGDLSSGAITTSAAAALTGGGVAFGRIDAASLTATATTGALTGGAVTVGDAATIAATQGTVDLGLVTTTGGDVTITAAGRLAADGVIAGGAATLRTTGAGGDILLATGLDAQQSVLLQATGDVRAPTIRSRAGDLTITAPNGELAGFVAGTGVTLDAGPGRAFTLTIGSAARLGDVAGGKLSVVATAISAGRIDTGTEALDLRATSGDLALSGPATGGAITLAASGRTSVIGVTATGALTLNGGTALGFTDIAGATIEAGSGGAITGTSARSTGALTIRGGSLALGQATAGAGMTLAATGGDLALTRLTAGSDATLSATGAARIDGAVVAGGAYRVTGGSVTLGGDGVVQQAAGEVRITTTAGDLTGARGLTLTSDSDGAGGDRLVLDSAGGIAFAGTVLNAQPLALRAGGARAIQLGTVTAGRIGGFDGNAIVDTLSHDAGFAADDIKASAMAVTLTRGDLSVGRLAAGGDVALRTDAGTIALGDTRAAGLDLASSGALTTGAVTSTGAVSLKGERIDVTGRLAAARQLLADARAALTLRDASAGGTVTLKAGGTLAAGTVDGTGITAGGAGVTLAAAKAGDALALTSTGDLSLGGGSAGGTATLDVTGRGTIGGLAAGPSLSITAGDVALTGPVRAQTVSFTTRAPATTALRIGDGTAANGLRLSDAEVRQVTADTLRFDAGTGSMEVGALTLDTGSGRVVQMLGTADIRVTGTVKTNGTGRAIRLGGGIDTGNAAAIHVVATRDAGGRLLFDGSDVELRGNRIAVGLAPGFIDTLAPGAEGLAQAQALTSNGNSTLYNTQLGGGFYDPNATTTLSARSLSVRFGDYALFQNTAIPGEFSGVAIGGTPAAPVSPALSIATFGPPALGSVALFGTINGVKGTSAALLGSLALNIDPALLPNSRINGCLAGSGAGCITTIVIQPTLQVFDWNSEEVFGIARDVTVPFAPVIGGNTEELLTDLPALAPQSPTDRKGEP